MTIRICTDPVLRKRCGGGNSHTTHGTGHTSLEAQRFDHDQIALKTIQHTLGCVADKYALEPRARNSPHHDDRAAGFASDVRDRIDRMASEEVTARTRYIGRFQDAIEGGPGLCHGLCFDLSTDIHGFHLPTGPGRWRHTDR